MGEKSYLKNQVYLPGFNSYDLFTEQEFEQYMKIVEAKNELNRIEKDQKSLKQSLITKKKEAQSKLNELINKHDGIPREVRLKNVIYHPDSEDQFPAGVTWHNLNFSKKISEFSSELTRAMKLERDYTLDQIVVKWKSLDVMHQLITDGFYMKILNPDGSTTNKHYHFFTASAGQLRRDKLVFISDEMWEKIKKRIECGLPWDVINAHGGICTNKLMAYTALPGSATDEWTDFDLDRCIVINQFKGKVTDRMMYINHDYTYKEEVCTVEIDHTDGCGMMLPSVSDFNFMVRGPYVKGLLCVFDYLKFCEEKGVRPVIVDYWGLEHDLVKENIQIIFTESMVKMAKFYDSWQDFKDKCRSCGAMFGKMNYEEEEIDDTTVCYQFTQTLTDFTDEEIKEYTKREHDRIMNVTKDKDTMIRTLKGDVKSDNPYKAALAYYPEMLWEGYTRSQLKDTRKRMLLDAKSGKIRMLNKRLFAIPDLYAACEYWFCHIEEPEGLLKNGEIACSVFRKYNEADVLRSPHLYCEHRIEKISHDPEVYKWFNTNGVYTSCKDLISRVLQFDVDGDQLNVIVDPLFVSVAKRNIEKYDVIPLFYEANKPKAEPVTKESLYNGLKRAHDYSSGGITSIGEISNMLTRLWNRENPDRVAAAWLTMFNNLTIDAAKTGQLSHYKDYPAVARKINKAIGGKNGRLPYWFAFSKNGRKAPAPGKKKRKYLAPNNSTMNRICAAFSDIGNINLHNADISPFNWQMFLSEPCKDTNPEMCKVFCDMDNINISGVIEAKDFDYFTERESKSKYELLAKMIIEEMTDRFGPLENSYPYIVKFLFADKAVDKAVHKQMFWRVYGDIALKNLKQNLSNYKVCKNCSMKYPIWAETHTCIKDSTGFVTCIDCGAVRPRMNSKQQRCEICQDIYNKTSDSVRKRNKYKKLKEEEQQRITSLVSRLEKT